jgi:hypothetical protein
LRKAKLLEEESLKLTDNIVKKDLLASALEIYLTSMEILKYFQNKSKLENSAATYIHSNIQFVSSKIGMLSKECGMQTPM